MPMLEADLRIARELKERIAQVAPLVDFKVFGSRARGDAGEFSDLDVFIEVETLDGNIKEKIADVAWEVGFNNGCIHISPLVFTRHEIEKTPLRVSSIVQAVAAEGVRI